jgi:hypothetical protein
VEHDARLAGAGRAHVLHLAFACADLLYDDARIGLIDVDRDFFDRFETLTGYFVGLIENARTADGELESFAPHRLQKHAQLEFAAAGDLVGALLDFADVDRDIALGFTQQTVADDAALHLVAFAARER